MVNCSIFFLVDDWPCIQTTRKYFFKGSFSKRKVIMFSLVNLFLQLGGSFTSRLTWPHHALQVGACRILHFAGTP